MKLLLNFLVLSEARQINVNDIQRKRDFKGVTVEKLDSFFMHKYPLYLYFNIMTS